MCTHKLLVHNKRTGRLQYVNCGHCKACLQEKANKRTKRIRNHEQSSGRICLFITLTYDNKFIPYFRPSEVKYNHPLTIYRDVDIRYKRVTRNYVTLPVAIPGQNMEVDIAGVTRQQRDYFCDTHFNNLRLPELRRYNFRTHEWTTIPDKVGICLYKDFQDFYKRFEINFKREYGYRPTRSYCVTTEYGETYRRPHFHMLLFCYYDEKEKIIRHVRKAWPYNGSRRKLLDIQVARSAASYVSQYVNCGSDFPQFLKLWFKPKFVYSHHFGYDNFYFRLSSILDMFQKNDWSYPCKRNIEGQSVVQYVPLPRYLLNRWFPQIVGYSRLSANTLFDIANRPHILQALRPYACQRPDVQGVSTIRLLNARRRFARYWMERESFAGEYSHERYFFPYLYAYIWSSYISYLQRWSYENYDVNDSWFNYYENIGDVIDSHTIRSDLSDIPLPDGVAVYRHPDEQPSNVRRSYILSQMYDRLKKRSKVSNLALTDGFGYDV